MTPDADLLQAVRGACGHDCPDTCSWIVEVRNGTAQRLSGDPGHPFTRGTLCAKVNHYLERVYHPDRVLHPLKRSGPKGEGRFVRVSWDEALAGIAAQWRAIVAESGAFGEFEFDQAAVSVPVTLDPARLEAMAVAIDLQREGWIEIDEQKVTFTGKAKNDKRFLMRQNGFFDVVPLAIWMLVMGVL